MGQELKAAGLAQGRITLKTAAEHINRLHQEATNFCKAGLLKAIEAGEELARTRSAIKHGAFGAWVESECEFTLRTAQRYMDLAENKDKLYEDIGPGQMSITTLNEGIAKLTQKRKEKKDALKAATLPAREPAVSENKPTEGAVDECIKGGAHNWEGDVELPGEFCAKCHEARPAVRSAPDADDSGYSAAERSDPEEEADCGLAERGLADDLLSELAALLKEAADLVDQAAKARPSPLKESVLTSLTVAYEDVLKWRK